MKEQMKSNTSSINNVSNTTSNVNNFTQIINTPKQPSISASQSEQEQTL